MSRSSVCIKAQEGTSITNVKQKTIIRKSIPNEIMMEDIRHLLAEQPGRTITIVVMGYSMRPFLEHRRDSVVLTEPHDIKVGDPVLAKVTAGKYVFHRIIKMEGEHLTLMGDGNARGTEECDLKDVIASTAALVRKGHHYLPTGRAWRIYSRVWVPLRPLRRWLLLPYRAYHKIKRILHHEN